jgi:Asp/Glu/hydantoin racemase
MDDIGMVMLDNSIDRPIGDVGNPETFDFPITVARSPGATAEIVVEQSGAGVLDAVRHAALSLQEGGVRAITTCCGFLAIFQEQLVDALDIPVATSSLLQVPLAQRLIGRAKTVCVVTANASTMTQAHLAAVGITSDVRERVELTGLEHCTNFQNFIHERAALDFDAVRAEVVDTVTSAVRSNPGIGAIVLECTNLPPFTPAIKEATGLPVWDAVSMINWLNAGVHR